MKQLTQKLGSGEMKIQELPIPQVSKGMVLVQTHYSIISAGTESSTVKAARKSILGKVRDRPAQAKQVLESLKEQGPGQTYRAVMKRLDEYSPLGYSASGQVIEVAEDVTEFSVGDKVACAGAGYANHAEILSVPVNLCVKLHPDVDLKIASFNTIGAIAMQSIRQAELQLGECCAVIGLGLIGQLVCLMLRVSGVRVVGIDIDDRVVKLAQEHACDLALNRNVPGVTDKILEYSKGIGVDSVIIAAATDSSDPINFSGAIARKKGKIIVLGAVPTGFDREPYFYQKELELRMACSYGPGRYDIQYEEKGIDYPVAYVRWTEKRNMEAFQDLITCKRINIDYLITHEFSFGDASEAYDFILGGKEPFLGVVLKYDTSKEIYKNIIHTNKTSGMGKISIGFIGAGNYAQGHILPNIPKSNDITRTGVLTNKGTTSKRVAEKYGFQFSCSSIIDLFKANTNTIFITTRHDTHASYVMDCLQAGKNVFVEKPLCINKDQLQQIKGFYDSGNQQIMVGFNRRFSPLATELKAKLQAEPVSMIYRINAGYIPASHWIQDKEIGGGRVIGEVCHFIDFLTWLCGSLPVKVQSFSMNNPNNLHDNICINIKYGNGSIGTIQYFSNGSKSLPKELIEVYQTGFTGVLNNFKSLELYENTPTKKRRLNQDKGQKKMVKMFLDNLVKGKPAPISFEEIYSTTITSFKVLESLKNEKIIII